MIRVAVDVLGGDLAPDAPIEGALAAVEAWPDEVQAVLVGPPSVIEPRLGGRTAGAIDVLPAESRIEPTESPALAVRRKTGSSIVRGLEAVRDGEADALISAGPTGAVMAASVLTLGLLPGVDRPPVGALFPTASGRVLVLDVGANVNSRPRHLHQFALLGALYVEHTCGVRAPRVGLLNVGVEPEKGSDVAVAAYRMLSEDPRIGFVGNIEGHQIIGGACEVVVCDGFVGNALLKFYESMAGFIMNVLERSGISHEAEIDHVLRFLDYTEYGGAPLLGVGGVTVICHGMSPARAITNAIRTAADSVRSEMVAHMRETLTALESGEEDPA